MGPFLSQLLYYQSSQILYLFWYLYVEDKDKNRIVSKNSKKVIEKSKCDVRARAHDKTTTTNDEINKMKKQVTWKDEMKKTSN